MLHCRDRGYVMKKIICSFLCLFICVTLSCEAKPYKFPKEQRKQYKIEIEQKLDIEKEKAKQEADKIYNQAFNSSEFDRIKKLVNLQDSVAKKLISAFSMYEGMCGLTEKMDTIEYMQSTISRLYQYFKKRLNGIPISVSNILDYASKANVKLEFREKNPIAERLLIIYYSDMCNFEYYRNCCNTTIKKIKIY